MNSLFIKMITNKVPAKIRMFNVYFRLFIMNFFLLLNSPLLVFADDTPPDGGDFDTGDMPFGGLNIFPSNYFSGSTYEVTLKIVSLVLNAIFLIGFLFFAWKMAMTIFDYFNQDVNHINYQSHKRTMFIEILEPVIGLALIVVFDIIINIVFSTMLQAAGDLNQTGINDFTIQNDYALNP